jgi:hypothetical protein
MAFAYSTLVSATNIQLFYKSNSCDTKVEPAPKSLSVTGCIKSDLLKGVESIQVNDLNIALVIFDSKDCTVKTGGQQPIFIPPETSLCRVPIKGVDFKAPSIMAFTKLV